MLEENLLIRLSWQKAADGTFLPSNVSLNSRYEAVETINHSTIKYMEELEEELSSMPGYKKPTDVEIEKESLTSYTDPECGYIIKRLSEGHATQTDIGKRNNCCFKTRT